MKLCEKIVKNIQTSDSTSQIDEMIENICIILTNNKDIYKQLDKKICCFDDTENGTIQEYLTMLSKTKPKSLAGLTTKSLFRIMETMEEILK